MSWQHTSILFSKITRETFQWNSSKGQQHTTDMEILSRDIELFPKLTVRSIPAWEGVYVCYPPSFPFTQLSSLFIHLTTVNHSLAVTHPPKAPRALCFSCPSIPLVVKSRVWAPLLLLVCSLFSRFPIMCYSTLSAKQRTLILSVVSEYFPCIQIIFNFLSPLCLYTKPHIPLIHTNIRWDISVLISMVEGNHSFSPTNSFVESLSPRKYSELHSLCSMGQPEHGNLHAAAKVGTTK